MLGVAQDEVIERFEVQFTEAQAEGRQLAAGLAEARRRAEAAESRAAELLEQRAKARRAQERQLAEAANLQAALRAEMAALKVSSAHTIPPQSVLVSVHIIPPKSTLLLLHIIPPKSMLVPQRNSSGLGIKSQRLGRDRILTVPQMETSLTYVAFFITVCSGPTERECVSSNKENECITSAEQDVLHILVAG